MTTVQRPSGRPAAVAGQQRAAELRETHSAVVIFLGDRVYKVKKPVDLGFLDFSTREKRLRACQREVDLNRRLAPDVYLGVADLHGPDHRVEEHLVVMRRLPEERKLARLVLADAELEVELRRLARRVASFHSRCARGARISAYGGRDALRARWETNLVEALPFHGSVLDADAGERVRALSLAYLEGRERLFQERRMRGAIVDGHGDLLAEDIFLLPDGPRILDCIEFDDTLRYVDRLDDAAFLAMDLERLGAADLGRSFLDWYAEFSGDNAPDSLKHHFVAYRAFVRAKVACLRHVQGDMAAAGQARQLLELTHAHLLDGEVRLTLVGGTPGSGKTTTASQLADRLGMTLLSTDRLRKELAGIPAEQPSPAEWQRGLYSPDWTKRTYEVLLERARMLLQQGESVILDASWADAAWRGHAAAVAAQTSSRLVQLECRVDPGTADFRIRHREGISDADVDVAGRMREVFDVWPGAVTLPSAEEPLEQVLRAAIAAVRPTPSTEVLSAHDGDGALRVLQDRLGHGAEKQLGEGTTSP